MYESTWISVTNYKNVMTMLCINGGKIDHSDIHVTAIHFHSTLLDELESILRQKQLFHFLFSMSMRFNNVY